MQRNWPVLSYEKAKDTYETLHMWTQIVGKLKLARLPWVNHSWHVTLHITPSGFSTMTMPYRNQHFQIDFDFIAHQLKVITSQGELRTFDLQGISVAGFYRKILAILKDLEIDVEISPVPVEIENPISFEKDTAHATYNKTQVCDLHQALLHMQDIFIRFRCGFKGKCSPVHFFWGSFDLAVSRFSGRKAPRHPGGIPNLPDRVAEEAYSHEVSSCGFWPGSQGLPEPAFYCYLYPEPEGYPRADVKPNEAYYHKTLREFILPYQAVQRAEDPANKLLEFLDCTYEAGARLAKWDRGALED